MLTSRAKFSDKCFLMRKGWFFTKTLFYDYKQRHGVLTYSTIAPKFAKVVTFLVASTFRFRIPPLLQKKTKSYKMNGQEQLSDGSLKDVHEMVST